MTRSVATALLLFASAGGAAAASVAFPFGKIPRHLWARELVWLRGAGFEIIEAPDVPADGRALATQAGLTIANAPPSVPRVSLLDPDALIKSRKARGEVVWTEVESEAAPFYRRGAISFSGEGEEASALLRREAAASRYWSAVLLASEVTAANTLPDTLTVHQWANSEASAVSAINTGKSVWTGEIHAAAPSLKHTLRIPDVTLDPHDALLLPVDVAFASSAFCRWCSGMSNSERLLYATAELTQIEYENGILSFEFYAPHAGVAVLQLEREPAGPMLAAGRPIAFDWDAESKRARLPIPLGAGAGKRVRIAITMTEPDHVASFANAKTLVIGERNRIVTEYSSAEFAKRSRLIVPAGWHAVPEIVSPTETAYLLDVPKERLHGEREELRIEADGISMSHVRAQLLRPVSLHISEAVAIALAPGAELTTDPPLVVTEAPAGRNITVQLRNNAPEIRTFRVELQGEGVQFSPANQEISVGASAERELTVRVFPDATGAPLRDARVLVSGAATASLPLRLAVMGRGETIQYETDLGTGVISRVWEDKDIRAVFSPNRWLEFYWKPSGRSLLPVGGVALPSMPRVELRGDELVLEGGPGLLPSGKQANLSWTAETSGLRTLYRVTETH